MATSFMKTIDDKHINLISFERMKHDILNLYSRKRVFKKLTAWMSEKFFEGELK